MNEHEVCAALFFFFSAHKTPLPTFTACCLVSGESIGLYFSCCLSPLSAVLCPLFQPWKHRTGWGGGEAGGIMGREQAWPLSTSILTAPRPPSSLGVSGRARLGRGRGGRVNIFKCLRYVLDIFSFKLEI